jgi:acyl-CoA thioesterase
MTFAIQPVAGTKNQFDFPVTLAWCSETHLFGGASFGALVEALEASSGKPLLHASIQFLERGKIDTTLRIETRMLAEGKSVAQAQAQARAGDALIVSAMATMGAIGGNAGITSQFPGGPDPDSVPVRKYLRAIPGSITDTQDVRLIGVDGLRVRMWMRMPKAEGTMSASILALLSDQVSAAMGFVMGIEKWWGLTLDGSLRIASDFGTRGASDWLLVTTRFEALTESFGHGAIEMWSRDGTLLATAAQSVRPRRW